MPLKTFFQEQIDQLRAFMVAPDEVVRAVQVAPDLKPLLLRVLVRMAEEPEHPHVFIGSETSFETPEQYLDALYSAVRESFARHEEELLRVGVDVREPLARFDRAAQPGKFVEMYAALADAMPDAIGSLVLILDPADVHDRERFRMTLKYVADYTMSGWAKIIVLDALDTSWLEGIEETTRAGRQLFHLPPEAIEKRAQADLERGGLSRAEERQYIALLGGFAFGKKNYDRAQLFQEHWLRLAREDDERLDIANAYYNLGNTHLAKKAYAAAEACFANGVEVCLEDEIDALLPQVLVNLGVAVFHQQRYAEALQCFEAAKGTSEALGNRPGTAHVLDCMARTCQADKMHADAETFWLEALALYQGITAEAFADVREAGIKDITLKLEALYKKTGQKFKIPQLKQATFSYA